MSKSNITLLLVDDDLVDSECIVRHLKKRNLNYDAHMLQSGAEALAYLREHCPNEKDNRVLVLLDINMPCINGHEFLEEIRNDEALRSIIVFVCTSSTHERDITKAYEKNVAGYFVKGDPKNVLDTIVPYTENIEFPMLRSA